MKRSVRKCLYTLAMSLLSSMYVFSQNVVDSDLSNNAGTNKNFSEEWWLFGIIGLVVLVLLLAYSRRKRRKM